MFLDRAYELASALIRKEEGLRLKPYRDPVGYPTIGYGHRIPDMKTDAITVEAAEKFLRHDLTLAIGAVLREAPGLVDEPPERLAALASFTYNVGAGKWERSTLRKRVREENWPAAVSELKKWVHARDVKTGEMKRLPGLVARREREAALLGVLSEG